MILLGLVEAVWAAVIALVDLFPTITLPAGITDGSSFAFMGTLGSSAGAMHAWVDFSQVGVIVTAMVAVYALSFVVAGLRRVGSAVPFVGNAIKGDN